MRLTDFAIQVSFGAAHLGNLERASGRLRRWGRAPAKYGVAAPGPGAGPPAEVEHVRFPPPPPALGAPPPAARGLVERFDIEPFSDFSAK